MKRYLGNNNKKNKQELVYIVKIVLNATIV